MNERTLEVVGAALLLVASLLGLAWLIWGRRPAEAESVSDLETMRVAYPKLPHPDEEKFSEAVPERPPWMRQRNPERVRRWDLRTRGEVGSEDRG